MFQSLRERIAGAFDHIDEFSSNAEDEGGEDDEMMSVDEWEPLTESSSITPDLFLSNYGQERQSSSENTGTEGQGIHGNGSSTRIKTGPQEDSPTEPGSSSDTGGPIGSTEISSQDILDRQQSIRCQYYLSQTSAQALLESQQQQHGIAANDMNSPADDDASHIFSSVRQNLQQEQQRILSRRKRLSAANGYADAVDEGKKEEGQETSKAARTTKSAPPQRPHEILDNIFDSKLSDLVEQE